MDTFNKFFNNVNGNYEAEIRFGEIYNNKFTNKLPYNVYLYLLKKIGEKYTMCENIESTDYILYNNDKITFVDSDRKIIVTNKEKVKTKDVKLNLYNYCIRLSLAIEDTKNTNILTNDKYKILKKYYTNHTNLKTIRNKKRISYFANDIRYDFTNVDNTYEFEIEYINIGNMVDISRILYNSYLNIIRLLNNYEEIESESEL